MIIAFTGRMGSGKSTAIQILKDMGLDVVLIKFADPLYDMQEMIYRRIEGAYKRPETFVKDRKLLQWLGTEWGRNHISETLWVDLWKADAHYTQENYPWKIIVCDDVRFDNEAETVRSLGGKVIKLETTKYTAHNPNGISNHVSELGVDSKLIDDTILNNDSVDELRNQLISKLNLKEIKHGTTKS